MSDTEQVELCFESRLRSDNDKQEYWSEVDIVETSIVPRIGDTVRVTDVHWTVVDVIWDYSTKWLPRTSVGRKVKVRIA